MMRVMKEGVNSQDFLKKKGCYKTIGNAMVITRIMRSEDNCHRLGGEDLHANLETDKIKLHKRTIEIKKEITYDVGVPVI